MLRKLQLSAVLLAWLLATGSQWDLVQTFAWGRMIASYARTMPLGEAMRLTFTSGNQCNVCALVEDARRGPESAPAAPAPAAPGKMLFIFQPAPAIVFAAPAAACCPPSDFLVPGASRAAPPLPPPRASAA